MLVATPSFYHQLVKKYNTTIDDISRLSEAMFGVIMVLTFMCAMSVMEITRQEVSATLFRFLFDILEAFIAGFTMFLGGQIQP